MQESHFKVMRKEKSQEGVAISKRATGAPSGYTKQRVAAFVEASAMQGSSSSGKPLPLHFHWTTV
jgi:hypothetical protein